MTAGIVQGAVLAGLVAAAVVLVAAGVVDVVARRRSPAVRVAEVHDLVDGRIEVVVQVKGRVSRRDAELVRATADAVARHYRAHAQPSP